MIEVELQVVLAAPDHFDRPPDFLREQRRLGDEVRLRLATEAAAEQRDVAHDVALVDAQCSGDRLLCRLRILDGRPRRHLAVAEIRHRHRRLHSRVRVVRDVVRSFDDLAALRELGIDVATAARDLARLLHGGEQLLLVCDRVVRGVRARVPLELQSLASLERRPRVVGNHRHAAERLEPDWRLPRIERDDLTDAAHGERRLVVHGFQRRAEDGRVLDGGVQHSVDFGIHPEDSLAADDVAEVVDGVILADVPPRAPRLELQRLRTSGRASLAAAGTSVPYAARRPDRLVHDLVQPGLALRRRHLPLRGGGLHRASRAPMRRPAGTRRRSREWISIRQCSGRRIAGRRCPARS